MLIAALTAQVLIGTGLPFVGLRDFAPLPFPQILAVFGYAALCCLLVNDTIKVLMLRRMPLADES